MKYKTLICITAMTLFAALAIPVSLAADDDDGDHHHKHHHYKLIDMGTFGGPASNGIPFVNNRGVMVGQSALSTASPPNTNPYGSGGFDGLVPFVMHVFTWQDGDVTDLGALPPADQNFSVPGPINEQGEVVGASENGFVDPIIGFNEIRAVVWKDGQILDLGTLGGNESYANAINDHGQVVGFALNGTPDPFSMFDFGISGSAGGTQTRAFLWDEKNRMQDLGTLGGDDSEAVLINKQGQIAGFSYTNSSPNSTTGIPTIDPFLLRNGKMLDLGTLGGSVGFPNGLNNRAQVVGQSNLTGDLIFHPFLWTNPGPMQDLGTFGGSNGFAIGINDVGKVIGQADLSRDQGFHAFVWQNGSMADLGTLKSDRFSAAQGINSHGQIVGKSCRDQCDYHLNERAVLWEGGSIINLNDAIPPHSALKLNIAFAINDRGEIVGVGSASGCIYDSLCGRAFLLIPCDENHPGIDGCDYSMAEASAAAPQSSPPVRDASSGTLPPSLMRRMNRYRFPGRAIGPRNR